MRALEGRVARIERKLLQRHESDVWAEHVRALRALEEAYPLRPDSVPIGSEPLPEPTSPAAPGEPPPPSPPETHDIPEHMQIRPVRWRRLRGPADYGVDVDDEGNLPRTPQDEEYDPLAEEGADEE